MKSSSNDATAPGKPPELAHWERAPLWSLLTFHWVGQTVLKKANRKDANLSAADFGPLAHRHSYSANRERWERVWATGRRPWSGFLSIIFMYKHVVAATAVVTATSMAIQLFNAYFLFQGACAVFCPSCGACVLLL